jgi:hypothetical protein
MSVNQFKYIDFVRCREDGWFYFTSNYPKTSVEEWNANWICVHPRYLELGHSGKTILKENCEFDIIPFSKPGEHFTDNPKPWGDETHTDGSGMFCFFIFECI